MELYIHIQIQINQLLIFIEKLSPLPGFEPRTSQVPSQLGHPGLDLKLNIKFLEDGLKEEIKQSLENK